MKRNCYFLLALLGCFVGCDSTELPVPPPPSAEPEIEVYDVAIDPADDTSYKEVEEEIITDEDHEDYGDFIENYTPRYTVVITYNGTTVTCKGKPTTGVKIAVEGGHVKVTSTKSDIAYMLTGTTENGSFKLNSEKKAQVTLDGVNITNPTGAAINIQSSKTVLIQLNDETSNHLEDGKEYVLTDGEQQKGTLFSEGQLVFSGNGTLDVKSHYGHGIVSDDYVRMRGGNISVNAVRDGISTSDRFVMYGGVLSINAQQDGIDVDEGYIEIGGGQLTVNAVDEGITASYEGEDDGTINEEVTPSVCIKGGLIKVTTTGDKGHGLRAMSTLAMSGGILQTTVKGAGAKALMSEGAMSFTGGKVTAFTEGNALYEEGDLSSAAGIRSKGSLHIENMTIGVKSTGTGGKGINNVGDVVIKNSHVTAIAAGNSHQQEGLSSYSRGVAADGNMTLDGCVLLINSCDEPLRVLGELTYLNDAVCNGYKIK